MNLMSNENITWTVERERGISFDLTVLTDPESRQPEGAALHDAMRREIKLEAESGVKESTFGHPFGGQCRPQPRPAPPSPFSRGGAGPPNKRMRPPSFELRDSSSAKRGQWDSSSSSSSCSGSTDGGRLEQQHAPRVLGRTRSHSTPKDKLPRASSSGAPAGGGGSKHGHSGGGSSRVKAEAAESARAAASSAPRRRYVGGVDTVALTAELGLVDRRRCARRNSKSGAPYKVGAYTLEERAALVARFHAKRGRRIWRKKIKYDCRKKLADKRPRLKGRFVTQEELEGLDSETLAKVTGLGPWPPEDGSSDADAGEASDSSEGYTGPALTTSRHRGGKGGRRQQQQQQEEEEEEEEEAPQATAESPKSLCVKAAAAAARAAAAKRKFAAVKKEEEDEDADVDDDGTSSTSTSAASEESDKLFLSPGGADSSTGSTSSPGMERVSSSCKVSDLFAVKTEADMDMVVDQDQGQDQAAVHAEEEGVEEERCDEDGSGVKVEGYEPTDPVFGFMVDDIMSNSFSTIVPSADLEGMSTEVAVS